KIVNERAPVEMPPLLRIEVLVKRRAVELTESMRIIREMPGHPIEDNAQSGAMAGVDQHREVGGFTEAARRREHPDRLIPPRAVKRVLGNRKELNMGKSEVPRVSRQFLGQLAITEPAAVLLRAPAPGAEMDLIDRDRGTSSIDVWRRRRS